MMGMFAPQADALNSNLRFPEAVDNSPEGEETVDDDSLNEIDTKLMEIAESTVTEAVHDSSSPCMVSSPSTMEKDKLGPADTVMESEMFQSLNIGLTDGLVKLESSISGLQDQH